MAPPKKRAADDNAWHLDKRVPIAIIFALLAQSGSVIWWSAAVSERLTAVERKVDQAAPQADRLTKVETRLESVQSGITEIKDILRNPLPKSR